MSHRCRPDRIAWTLLAGSALALSATAPARAQAQASAEVAEGEEALPGDIIVTAQRRAERLRDVPVAISAITADDIASRGVTDLDQMQAAVPGLRLVDIGPGSRRIQLRGVSQFQGLPTVGNYLDEFSLNPYTPSGVAEVRLLDMERVEVLRGPQPVLYGEGAMGGSIRYITASPDLDDFGATALGEIQSVRDGATGYRFEGVINAPIVQDKLGLRIAAAREKAPGWIDGALGNNLNETETTTVRAKLLARPSDALSVSLLGLYNRSFQPVKSFSDGKYQTSAVVPSPTRQRYALGVLDIDLDVGPFTVKSVTGYLDQSGRSIDDSARFYNGLFGAPLLRTALTDADSTLKKFSQELRVTSNGTGPLRYVFGASYTWGKTDSVVFSDGESLVPGLPASALGLVFRSDLEAASKIWAFFGNAGYDLTDRLTIDLGGRYFIDKRTQDSALVFTGIPSPPQPVFAPATFKTFNPRAAITWKTGESGTVYASVARGFRSGGFNQITAPVVPPTFRPEKLWTYEIGAKQSLIGDSLYVEASIYFQDYKGIQANQLVNPSIATVINSGSADGPGFDLSIAARPSRDFSVAASLGYSKIRFTTDTVDRLKGEALDLVPDWNWSVAVDYTPQLSDAIRLIAHADLNFIDAAKISIRSLTFTQIAPTDARAIANLRLGLDFGRWQGYAFMNNVFDETKRLNPAFGAFPDPIWTRPRSVGLGVRAGF